MSATGSTLQVRELVAGYGGLPIVNGVSLAAEPSRLTVVIGPNGCGKSTTMRALAGLLSADEGAVRLISGDSVTELEKLSPSQRLNHGLAFVPQERTGFPEMSVHENLALGGWLWRRDRSQLGSRMDSVYEHLPKLTEWRNKRMGLLSGGQQKLVELGRALVSRPSVIILDEPTAGLAPPAAEELLELLRQLAQGQGVTVLMVEQNLEPALRTADHAYCVVSGRNSTDGPAQEILGRLPEIVESWLWD